MRTIGTLIWRFMVIFSFIVNIVLVVVLLLAGIFIFEIKNQVADPLIGGLHSTAAGLGDATIDWVIPVRDTIPVVLDIPLQTDTTVVLTSDVSLRVNAIINMPSLLSQPDIPATVDLVLPSGLALPVALNLNVPVNEDLDIALDVRAVIPLRETQLIDPINQLGLLFEPLAIGLWNLPDDFGQAGDFAGRILNGDINLNNLTNVLLATDGTGFNPDPYDAWLGYSQTAGLNYPLFNEQYPADAQAMETGIVVNGGIPALDAFLLGRQNLYADGNTPQSVNEAAVQNLEGINPATWNGTMAEYYTEIQSGVPSSGGSAPIDNNNQNSGSGTENQTAPETSGQTENTNTSGQGSGIIPTPSGN